MENNERVKMVELLTGKKEQEIVSTLYEIDDPELFVDCAHLLSKEEKLRIALKRHNPRFWGLVFATANINEIIAVLVKWYFSEEVCREAFPHMPKIFIMSILIRKGFDSKLCEIAFHHLDEMSIIQVLKGVEWDECLVKKAIPHLKKFCE